MGFQNGTTVTGHVLFLLLTKSTVVGTEILLVFLCKDKDLLNFDSPAKSQFEVRFNVVPDYCVFGRVKI